MIGFSTIASDRLLASTTCETPIKTTFPNHTESDFKKLILSLCFLSIIALMIDFRFFAFPRRWQNRCRQRALFLLLKAFHFDVAATVRESASSNPPLNPTIIPYGKVKL